MTYTEFLHRYEYDSETDLLGEGGFGRVYKAYDTIRDRYVALKIAPVKDDRFSLQKEVDLAGNIPEHRNIAHYENCFRFKTPLGTMDHGIMQYYPEGNLSQLLKRKNLTQQQKEEIVDGILNGMEHMHQYIVHRDLKPGNILISEKSGTYIPKITDFGISKKMNPDEWSRLSNSLTGGTIAYASPEQLHGEQNIRRNTDIWSFGVILFELLTGQLPFESEEKNLSSEKARVELFRKIDTGQISEKINSLNEPYRTAIRTCLERNSKKRAANVEELRDVLINPQPNSDGFGLRDWNSGGTTVLEKEADTSHQTEQPISENKQHIKEKVPPPSPKKKAGGSTSQSPKKRVSWPWIAGAAVVLLITLFLIGNNNNNTRSEKQLVNNDTITELQPYTLQNSTEISNSDKLVETQEKNSNDLAELQRNMRVESTQKSATNESEKQAAAGSLLKEKMDKTIKKSKADDSKESIEYKDSNRNLKKGNPVIYSANNKNFDADTYKSLKILNIPQKFSLSPKIMDWNYYPITHNGDTYEKNWVVYSDRNNNYTYFDITAEQQYKKASFLQKFFIVEEKGDFVHIVEDKTNPIDVRLSENAIDYGWIHKNKLILYDGSLKNQKNTHLLALNSSSRMNVSQNPDLNNTHQINANQIYFIYKKEKSSLLLGKAFETRGDISDNLIGWVSIENTENWKHMLAYEPNWEENAWRERKQKGVLAKIFSTFEACEKYLNGNSSVESTWDLDPVKQISSTELYKRADAGNLRFLVKGVVNENVVEVLFKRDDQSNNSFEKGFLPVVHSNLNNKLFKPVLLVSRSELHEYQMMFDMLGDIIEFPMNERRQTYKNTLVELLSHFIGDQNTNRAEKLLDEKLSEIIYKTGGLHLATSILGASTNCVIDPLCMSNRDFNAFLSIMKSKAMRVEAILNDNNDPRKFILHGITYYWLDFDVLP